MGALPSARSPQTGLWGESNIGGFVGSELRYAGFDGLLITGRANAPVYLWIHNGQAELRDASHLWGKSDTLETQRILKAEVAEPMARVACIGLAGENRVPYAAILSDHGRLAGRTGMGAVIGSRKPSPCGAQNSLSAMQHRPCGRANSAVKVTAVYHETGGRRRLPGNAGRHATKVLDAGCL
jgi:aldehyde:ferredoxin oxidoreductase